MGLNEQQLRLLRKLSRCTSAKTRKQLLTQGGKSLQKGIREICFNVLKGTVPLSAVQKQNLQKHARFVRELGKKKTSHKRRIVVEQRGGFLPALLIPMLMGLAKNIISGVLS